MTERQPAARGRDVWSNNVTLAIAVIVALLVGYAWGRPVVQEKNGRTVAPVIEQVALTPQQQAQLDRLSAAIARMDDVDPATITPSERDAIDQAQDFVDSVTTTVVVPPPAPVAPPTTAAPPTTRPETGPVVHDLIVPQGGPPTTAATTTTVP
jgi:hypothetical protein